MASGVLIAVHDNFISLPSKVYDPLVGLLNLANLVDTSVGSVPYLIISIILKFSGVYSLAS